MRATACVRGSALALAAAIATACSTQPQKPVPPPPAEPVAPAPTLSPPLSTSAAPPTKAAVATNASPWQRLRDRFAMPGCDYRPQVMRWARRYTASPRRFEGSWEQAMPFFLIVVDEVDRRGLPGEFALLPYLESGYEPVATRGDRPAGMWQIVPDTARAEGLAITADYDARLDARASTAAALGLLDRYQKQFGDWRLADMAFNSGEYRVRALLRGRDAKSLSAEELGKLAFNPITHDHLDRLLALACIVSEPAKFGVELPEPGKSDVLEAVVLQAGMDVRLAARLADVDPAAMKRYNAAYRRHRMAGAPHRLLMPADRVERFRSAADAVPVALWNDWREQRAARTSGIAAWAAEVGVPVAVLAAANALDEKTTVTASTRLLLPGRDAEADAGDDSAKDEAKPRVHVVKRGDTLSGIAQRYKVSLAELKRLNPSAARKALQLGERLRVPAGAD